MAKPIVLRAVTPEDLQALHALDQECYPPGIAYSVTELRYFLGQRGVVSVIAEDGAGLVAGFAIAQPARYGKVRGGHIVTIDVASGARRKGVGTLLMDAVEKMLAQQKVTLIRLEVAIDNVAAQAFYLRRGFETKGTIRGYYMGTLDAIVMEKMVGNGLEV